MRLRRHLLASVSPLAIYRAWTTQTRAERHREDTVATATPSLANHDEPKASQSRTHHRISTTRGAETWNTGVRCHARPR
jgi:hypothetical protein